MDTVKLTDLIDIEILQKIQDSLSFYMGMSGLITDSDGVPVTEGSGFTDFCLMTRKSRLGSCLCTESNHLSALETLKSGKPTVYKCHSGLLHYAAPIMLDGTFIGSIIGGQVINAPLEEAQLCKTAESLGLDKAVYLAAARKIPFAEEAEVAHAAQFLTAIGSALSSVAFYNYQALQNSRKLERAAHAQTTFLIDMNGSMQKTMRHWIDAANQAVKNQDIAFMTQTLQDISIRGSELLNTLKDTVDYAKLHNGEIELAETTYCLKPLLEDICSKTQKYLHKEALSFQIKLDSSVPTLLLGDSGRIRQILMQLFQVALGHPETTQLLICACCQHTSYATTLVLEIQENSSLSAADIDLSLISLLLRQLSGSIEALQLPQKGILYTIRIPQLNAQAPFSDS